MTAVDVVFRYGAPPEENDVRAVQRIREVYGIRRILFDEAAHTVRVEFDATRLSASDVGALLRGAGLDLREQVQLV